MQGPIGPRGYNGSQGTQGVQGLSGAGNLTQCVVTTTPGTGVTSGLSAAATSPKVLEAAVRIHLNVIGSLLFRSIKYE